MTHNKDDAGRMARWLLRLGNLRQFDLAEQLRVETGDREEEADVSRALTRREDGSRRASRRRRQASYLSGVTWGFTRVAESQAL